jgi:hypothetical protein
MHATRSQHRVLRSWILPRGVELATTACDDSKRPDSTTSIGHAAARVARRPRSGRAYLSDTNGLSYILDVRQDDLEFA